MTLPQIISGSKQVLISKLPQLVKTAMEVPVAGVERNNRAFARTFQKGYDNGYARLSAVSVKTNKALLTKTLDGVSNKIQGLNTEDVFIDYILIQSVLENYTERHSPYYSLSSPIMMTSGSDAKIFKYTGVVLVNQLDGDQKSRFYRAYENFLRASASVSLTDPIEVVLRYRDQVRHGYLTNLSTIVVSASPNQIGIDLTMFVTKQYNL